MRIIRDKLYGFDPDRLAEIGEAFKSDPIGHALIREYHRSVNAPDTVRLTANRMIRAAVRAFMLDKYRADSSYGTVSHVSDYVLDARTLS